MFKARRIILYFLIIFATFLFLANYFSFDSFSLDIPFNTMLDGGFDVLPDNNGNFFILSYDKDKTKSSLAYLSSSDSNQNIKQFKFFINSKQKDTLDYAYTTANFYNDFLYLTSINGNNSTINKYQIATSRELCVPSITLPLTDGVKIDSAKQTALSNDGNLFILDQTSADSIKIFNDGGYSGNKLIKDAQTFHTITTDVSKNYLYAINSSNKLLRYKFSAGDYLLETLSNEDAIQNLKFLTDTTFVTSDGYIFSINKTDSSLISKVKIAAEIKNYPSCVTAGLDDSSILVKTEDNIISRVRCSDGAITGKIELENNILTLSTSGEKVIAITGKTENASILPNNVAFLTNENLIEITPPPPDPTTPEEPEKPEEDKPNPENPYEDLENQITSDIHYVDSKKYVISNIEVGTTFAELKNNLIFNGYSLILKDVNGNIKSGNSTKVGTGYSITFVKDGMEKFSYKLIVKGDITGTGTLTSRDIASVINYLLGKSELEVPAWQAANINDDGDVDTIDLFLMYKLLQK